MINTGNLFLIPTAIADNTQHLIVPPQVLNRLPDIHFFLAEEIRTARRYLSSLRVYEKIDVLNFAVLNKDTKASELRGLFAPVFEGHHLGLLSEAGCPGVADPGATAVMFAHQNGIIVIPLVGPSAILLSLMASGLNGQQFAFHGYLPIKQKESVKAIRELEKESRTKNQTQIFIETPYRNNNLFGNLVNSLAAETQLCVAVDVTGTNERIVTRSVKDWRLQTVELPKYPAVFLFLA